MSTLRSIIDQLASIDLSLLSDAAIDEELAETARAVDLLQSQLLRITAEVDRRGISKPTGSSPSPVTWRLPVG